MNLPRKLFSIKSNAQAFVLAAFLSPAFVLAASPQSDLMDAIHAGDPIKTEVALSAGANPNQVLADGSLPLAWAVDAQSLSLVNILLKHGAKPDANKVSTQNFSPLIEACQWGDAAIVNRLLDAGADVNRATASGISPLALCAGNSTVAVVNRLIELGAKVDAADETGQTPLMWAAAKGQVPNIKLLVSKGADVNRKTSAGFTPLFFAIKSPDAQSPLAVIDAGGDASYVAPDGTSAVQLAIYQKQFEFAAVLIKRGADLNAHDRNGNQLLHAAVLNHQPQLVKLLLEKGANPNALTGAAKVVTRFEVNFTSRPYVTYPKSPLLLAAELGDADLMATLVSAGADTKFRAQDGTNVLLAAAPTNIQALAYALKLAPDANVTTKSGKTALHLLMGYTSNLSHSTTEMHDMFQLLAKHGARTNIADKDGDTAAKMALNEEFKAKIEFAQIFRPQRLAL
ncbi:MAG: hypothetical protein EOO53_08850 [Gammaproteobacteria bacterium]|nr:MAG: hypothetical protein EOO53_08850 [Gammaproteobacteria bacterium]